MLDLKLAKAFGDFDIDVTIGSEALVTALFGPSGAGKSSILNMVAGLISPDNGHISLGGDVLFDSKKQINLLPEERHLGFVFQDSRLFPHLNVKRNLTYAKWAGKRESHIKFDHVVDVLNIAHLIDRMPENLSGGEKQRVAIGRALLAGPKLLLLDEPMASLDGGRRAQLLPFIQSVAREFKLPMLLVSHDLDDVSQLAEDLVLMDAGRVVASGKLDSVLALPEFQDNIGIQQSSTVLTGEITHIDPDYQMATVRLSDAASDECAIKISNAKSGFMHEVGEKVRLRVKSRDVALAIGKSELTSIQNCLFVTVQNIDQLDAQVRVKLVCEGQTIYSYITEKSFDELKLEKNQQIFALIKAVSLI